MKTDTTQSQIIANMSELQPIQDYIKSEADKAKAHVQERIQELKKNERLMNYIHSLLVYS